MEYTAKKLGPGRVSGEIIAGIEPIAATKRGIDRIVSAGAFPTVCIFRPTVGSDMADWAPPSFVGWDCYAALWCQIAGWAAGD